jgi:hypothetical protein
MAGTKVRLIKKDEYISGGVVKYSNGSGESLVVRMDFSNRPAYGGYSLDINESYVNIKVKTKKRLLSKTILNKEFNVGNVTEVRGREDRRWGVHSLEEFLSSEDSLKKALGDENADLLPLLRKSQIDILDAKNSEEEKAALEKKKGAEKKYADRSLLLSRFSDILR